MLETIAVATGIFLLRVLGNTVTTIRLVMLNRGRNYIVAVLSFFESLIFTIALGAVVTNLDSMPNLIAYCGGFAVGSSVGLWLEKRLTLGYVILTTFSRESGHAVAKAIREAGFGATEIDAHGADGDVIIIESIIERSNLSACTTAIQSVDKDAFITTQTLQSTRHGYIPAVRPGLARIINR